MCVVCVFVFLVGKVDSFYGLVVVFGFCGFWDLVVGGEMFFLFLVIGF